MPLDIGGGISFGGGISLTSLPPNTSSIEVLMVAGGGGGSIGASGGNGGNGGSGIIVIRYQDTYPEASTTGSPTYTTSGGYRIYIFTGNGSITI